MSSHEISFNTNLSDPIKTRADFIYKISPSLIQGSIASFKIMARDGKGFWHKVHWDNKTASLFPLSETDEQKAKKKLL